MKRTMMILAMMLAIAVSANAMSYKEAKRQALFLADKMAYELDLTDEQYEAAYEINLDYLMSVSHRDHLYGTHWASRNSLFRTILAPWQYSSYIAASYFYRPLSWISGTWHWNIYSRYGRSTFYRGRPAAYVSYHGGRSPRYYQHRNWRMPQPPPRVRHHAPRLEPRHGHHHYDARGYNGRAYDKKMERDMRKMERRERKMHDKHMREFGRGHR